MNVKPWIRNWRWLWLLWLWLLWLWLLCSSMSLSAQTLSRDADFSQDTDLRLLVDVSGSMRTTDPNRLRKPALELLVRLLPEGVSAGIWAFGGKVEPVVPHGPVDAAWKERARQVIAGLQSRARYTHIGAALESASYDRTGPASDRDAQIILLTDGMVDVSPDAAVNAREEEWLLRELVPKLAAAGYRIHTIGLSERADNALLQEIARATDGLFIEARGPDQLMESLLGVFQQSVPTNALPIEDGRFLVDESVREFTALIMRPEGAPAVQLVSPSGESHGRDSAKPGLNWHHTGDYDLITQANPQPGQWTLQTDMARSSRVSVISNMQLRVEPLTANPLVGQKLTLEFWLQNEQGVITDPDLLSLLAIKVRLEGPGEAFPKKRHWTGDRPPEDGRYQMPLPALDQPGNYRLILEVDGKTFQRRFSHRMRLGSLFSVELEQRELEGGLQYRVKVNSRRPLDEQNTSLVAHLQDSSGFSRVVPLVQAGEGRWQVDLAPEREARYRVSLRARGRTRGGIEFEQQLPSLYFTHPPEGVEVSDPLDEALSDSAQALESERESLERARRGESAPKPESEVVLGNETEAQSDPKPDPEPDPETKADPVAQPERSPVGRSVLLYGGVVLLNLGFFALAYWGYRKIMRPVAHPATEQSDQAPEDSKPSAPPSMQEIEPETGLETELELELGDDETRQETPAPNTGKTEEEDTDTAQEQDEDLDRQDLSEDEDSLFSLEDDQDTGERPEAERDAREIQTGDRGSEDRDSKDKSLDDDRDPNTPPPKQ